jgi:hypothetical protein
MARRVVRRRSCRCQFVDHFARVDSAHENVHPAKKPSISIAVAPLLHLDACERRSSVTEERGSTRLSGESGFGAVAVGAGRAR